MAKSSKKVAHSTPETRDLSPKRSRATGAPDNETRDPAETRAIAVFEREEPEKGARPLQQTGSRIPYTISANKVAELEGVHLSAYSTPTWTLIPREAGQ
ncbi:MAG: hypothetical protein Q8O79_01820 [Pseudomonadota bacterium]|nr:hypothetical protein [Pseudomonadota bacterium]